MSEFMSAYNFCTFISSSTINHLISKKFTFIHVFWVLNQDCFTHKSILHSFDVKEHVMCVF
jgi:hypothetical protein